MNETLLQYIGKAKTYLNDADLLISNSSYESAVSRAYYAMYFMLNAILFIHDIDTKTHQGAIMMFGKHYVKTGIFDKKFNNILTNALNQRIVGDYDIEQSIEFELAQDIVNDAHTFIAKVIEYLKKK
jgi:uncharacterized protein (UPF0332 family)